MSVVIGKKVSWMEDRFVSSPLTLVVQDEPFSEGINRSAFHAESSDGQWILKKFKDFSEGMSHGPFLREVYAECKHAYVASTLAAEFNSFPGIKKKIYISEVFAFISENVFHGNNVFSLELPLEGTFVKFNNNYGFTDKRLTPAAFSHFSYVRSLEAFLICDLQGVTSPCVDMYTDLSFHVVREHSLVTLGTAMDFSVRGVSEFFQTHVCGVICQGLGLSIEEEVFHEDGETGFGTSVIAESIVNLDPDDDY